MLLTGSKNCTDQALSILHDGAPPTPPQPRVASIHYLLLYLYTLNVSKNCHPRETVTFLSIHFFHDGKTTSIIKHILENLLEEISLSYWILNTRMLIFKLPGACIRYFRAIQYKLGNQGIRLPQQSQEFGSTCSLLCNIL